MTLLSKPAKQQNVLAKLHTSMEVAVKTSFVIAHKFAKNSKPFFNGEFIKECFVDSASLLRPEKKETFENVCLSW